MDRKLREYERRCVLGESYACYRAFQIHKEKGTPIGSIFPPVLYVGTQVEMEVQPPIDFRDLLEERERLPIGTPEKRFRSFNALRFNDGINISIQASYGHYCSPRLTVDKYEYTSWEISFPLPYEIHRFYAPLDEHERETVAGYTDDPNAQIIEDDDGDIEVRIINVEFLPGGILYGFPHQDEMLGGDDVVGYLPTEKLQDMVDFLRARFGFAPVV